MIAYKKLNMENFRVKKALNDNEMKMWYNALFPGIKAVLYSPRKLNQQGCFIRQEGAFMSKKIVKIKLSCHKKKMI
jgi:hypothetical protein